MGGDAGSFLRPLPFSGIITEAMIEACITDTLSLSPQLICVEFKTGVRI
jgi:hypothetical protein